MAPSASPQMSQPLRQTSISKSLTLRIIDEVDRMFPLETGGILMGCSLADGGYEITEVIGPGPRARHTRTMFNPDHDYQVHQVSTIYHASRRRFTYLGDWHSHPGGGPHLSSLDRVALGVISTSPFARCCAPLMLLVVGGPSWNMRLWQWLPAEKPQCAEVQLHVFDDHVSKSENADPSE